MSAVRFNERSFVVLVAAVLLVAVAVAVVLWTGSEDDDGSAPAPAAPAANAASSLEGGPDELLVLSGSALVRRGVVEGSEEVVEEMPTLSVYAAPGSSWLAYVTTKPGADDDFASEPVLHLYDAATGDKSGYGPGVAPVWNGSGTHVAFLRPVEPRDCLGEDCRGETQIGVVEATTGRETLLLEPGQYSILGWAGSWILVSDFTDPSKLVAVSLEDERADLDFPVSQFWDASPDGRWLVKTNAKKTEFVEFADGELGDGRVPIELGDYELLEGAWAHDSSRVAAVANPREKNNKRRKAGLTTEIVTFSPKDPEPAPVPDTFGATGTVLWATDNEALVFAALVDPKKVLFQARYCPLGNESACRIVSSWTEGVALLRME